MFGVTDIDCNNTISDSVINAAKEALLRMPVVDPRVLLKKQQER